MWRHGLANQLADRALRLYVANGPLAAQRAHFASVGTLWLGRRLAKWQRRDVELHWAPHATDGDGPPRADLHRRGDAMWLCQAWLQCLETSPSSGSITRRFQLRHMGKREWLLLYRESLPQRWSETAGPLWGWSVL